MKKGLLTALAFAAGSVAFAQTPNDSLSMNLKTADGEGFGYEFKAGVKANCLTSSDWNRFGSAGYEWSLDSTSESGAGIMVLELDGSQGSSTAAQNFLEGNCSLFFGGNPDFTNDQSVQIRYRSDVDVADFRIINAVNDGNYTLADGNADVVQLEGDSEWHVLTFNAGSVNFADTATTLELDKMFGWAVKATSADGSTDVPQGTIEFDYIRFGSAVETITANEEAVVSNVNVYPNPSTGVVNVEAEAGQSIVIRDMVGAQVAAGTETLKVSDLQAGIYVATITTAEGVVVETRKVIVK